MTENILTFSRDYHAAHPDVDYYIYGHLHLFERVDLGDNATLIVLGEWIARHSYARWDGTRLTLHTYNPQ